METPHRKPAHRLTFSLRDLAGFLRRIQVAAHVAQFMDEYSRVRWPFHAAASETQHAQTAAAGAMALARPIARHGRRFCS
eukprot:1880847-Pyramimonas_sp.AAC.1